MRVLIAVLATMAMVSGAHAAGMYLEGGAARNLTSSTEVYGTAWMGEIEGGVILYERQLDNKSSGQFMLYGEHTSSLEDGDTGQNMVGAKYRVEFDF